MTIAPTVLLVGVAASRQAAPVVLSTTPRTFMIDSTTRAYACGLFKLSCCTGGWNIAPSLEIWSRQGVDSKKKSASME